MKTMGKIGTIVTGAALVGAAFSGAVSAAFDPTGLDESFFYDSAYNPIVQIVVGEKGLASDSVAAGNVAAVVGNLAYTSSSVAVDGGGADASGRVVLGVSARGATGKYVQGQTEVSTGVKLVAEDSNPVNNRSDFYYSNEGLVFLNDTQLYERGEFVSYSLACDTQSRTEAGILKEGTYNNIHCLFCQTLCLETLDNPEHDIEEKIFVDYSGMVWYEDGLRSDDSETLNLEIDSKSLSYIVTTEELPMERIRSGSDPVDFEWRGKMILFGEEFYVKDIKGGDTVYLAKGKVLDDVSSEGFTAEYMGYKFKVDHLIYSAEYQVAGILLDVEKPDGTVVQTQVSKLANGIVDDIEISGIYAEEADAVATASLLVYDTASNVVLESGKDLEYGGEVKKYWRVQFATTDSDDFPDTIETSEYRGMSGEILHNVTITYRHDVTLEEGESLDFPSTYAFTFSGYRSNDYRLVSCSGDGEGRIQLGKDDEYKLWISFTGDDGQRYDTIQLDQGPFSPGDQFVVNGKIWEYDKSEEQEDDTTMRVTLKDILDGGKSQVDLTAVTTPSEVTLTTFPYEEAADNYDEIDISPDSDEDLSDVFSGNFGATAVDVVYDGGDLFLFPPGTITTIDDITPLDGIMLGVHPGVTGPTALDDFEENGQAVSVWVVKENGSDDLNNEGSGLNTDDVLVQYSNDKGEYVLIDFYDRDYDDSTDTRYMETVKVVDTAVTNAAAMDDTTEKLELNEDRDTLAILPRSGARFTVDYGADNMVNSVEICHPQEDVYVTTFIGTGEEATMLESVITKEDEGTEKTSGCCTYTVKEFGVSTSSTPATSVQVNVNPLVGNLVVPEVAADTSKNLIVVGGPAVNGLTTVTAAEIQAASQNYLVKKDGKKLIVAGWTAADTVDAGNALIAWLKDNAHTGLPPQAPGTTRMIVNVP